MNLPTGTVTFLFTDIAGSAKIWQDHPETMPSALARHNDLLRQAIQAHNGFVVKTIGDAFMAVFASASDGLAAAWTAQRNLCREPWPPETPLRVRMGLHAGAAEERENDYFGHEVNRAARIQAVVHPEQIVVSQTFYDRVQGQAPDGVTLLDLGLHQLRDLREPERLWQLCHPDLPAAFPPLNSLTHCPNNLPRQLSSFVGREKEIAEIQRLLAGCSCLTLAGSGGGGKTRLALQAAAEILPDYPHGVWLVELAALTEPSLVPQTVATEMGLREEALKPLMQTLTEYAASRTLLLLLDNCEHLIAACAQLAITLLRACPHLKILLTSREPLNIAGEQVYRVPALTTPDSKQPQTPQTLQQYEAARLFIDRALAVKADFAVTDRNASALAQICHRLDGIPLAIELAAARVRSMSAEDINNRLNHRFRMLTGGSRSVLQRQQTLQALIDWSYDLLNDQEKLLLAHLAVFAGGWTLETAEQVCNGEGIEDWEVLDLLTSLTDKSLVLAEEKEGSVRYRMLETVREYAAEKLKAGGEEAPRRQGHRDFFLALAEEAGPSLRGPAQGLWLACLESEHDNLNAALAWSLSEPEGVEASLRLCAALSRFWMMRSHLGEGRVWCDSALAQAGATDRSAIQIKTLTGSGGLATMQGDYAAAKACYEQSLALSRELEDRHGIATALGNLGNVATYQGELALAKTYQEESLKLRRDLEDRVGMAYSLSNLGVVANKQGDYTAAKTYAEQSLAIQRDLGDPHGIASSLGNLGNVLRLQGDHTAALAAYQECQAIFTNLGDQRSLSISLENLGRVANDLGDYAKARTYYEQSLRIYTDIGDRQGIGNAFLYLGIVTFQQGDYASARDFHEQSLTIQKEIGNLLGIASSLGNLGNVARMQGDYAVARVCYEQSVAIARTLGDRQSVALSLHNLGHIACLQSDYETARTSFEQSLTMFREIGDPLEIARALEASGKLAFVVTGAARDAEKSAETAERVAEGSRRAARLWGAAQALRERIGSPQPPNEQEERRRDVAAACESLDTADWEAAWAEGQALTMEQAIAYALEETKAI